MNEELFNTLVQEWKAETGMMSLTVQKSNHPAYQKIISMGQPIIPLILKELEREPDYWFWALRAITNVNPVKPEQQGNVKQMTEAWLSWGKEQGYLL